jgi:ribosome biogenesis GTPase
MRGLDEVGWDQGWEQAFEGHASAGLRAARVAVEHRGEVVVLSADGEHRARVAGRLRHHGESVVVGDWVACSEHATWRIEEVLPRRGALVRRAAGTAGRAQPLAANVDVVLLVCGLDGDFNPRRVERTLVLVAESGARPVVVLNKADACRDLDARRQEMARAAPGVAQYAISALSGDGVEALRAEIAPGVTLALLGSSGAGKSTLANRLLGTARQATSAVREDDSRGRHTTTRRELIVLPGGGVLVDTPGLRELQLWAGEDSAAAAFTDIDELARRCRFADCVHGGEPGCAVLAAVASGLLEPERLLSHRKLQGELRHAARQHDAAARSEQERRWRVIHKAARRHRPRW